MSKIHPGSKVTSTFPSRSREAMPVMARDVRRQPSAQFLPEGGARATPPVPSWSLQVVLGYSGEVTLTADGDYQDAAPYCKAVAQIVNDPGTGTAYSWDLSTANWGWVNQWGYSATPVAAPGSDQSLAYLSKNEHGAEVLTVSATIGGVTQAINVTLDYAGS